MKKLLLFVTMAASLLFTQCKKEDSVSSAGKTVSMTVTAGPGSKTDITDAGTITWSAGDKLYVGDGSKYIGCLTIASGVGTPTGVFTGNVTLPTDTKDGEKSFGFFYLGSETPTGLAEGATSVEVKFDSQTGLREDLGSCHVGYGSAKGTVINDVVTDINVTMLSKVAIARFCFTKENSKEAYEGALTLKGDNICNKMTVNFNSTEFACEGTEGEISLTNTTSSEKYVMLVPTEETMGPQTLTFADANVKGSYTLANGIEANKFYGLTGAIAVTLEAAAAPSYLPGEFTINSGGTKVKFSKGNLQYLGKGATWRFADNQWDILGAGPNATSSKGNVDLSSLDYTDGMYNTGSGNAGGSETDADKNAARDLFGWGATGYQDTRTSSTGYQTNYMPYSTSKTNVASGTQAYDINRYGYGPDYYNASEYGLSVEAKSDWGAVPGLPPAGEGKTWRTLTKDEWVYLMSTRTVNDGKGDGYSYQRATVNGVYGMILYPDSYTAQSSLTSYSGDTWTSMEEAGVVFLPVAGYRSGTSLADVGSRGYYWSSTPNGAIYAYYLYFSSSSVSPQNHNGRCLGYSVRLVR